jgi:glycosyltransferase involved in cell wall biosynthesis
MYGVLSRSIKPAEFNIFLVHTSLHNHPNLLQREIRKLGRYERVVAIADARDPRLPKARFTELSFYDAIIACSRSVEDHLRTDPFLASKISRIPIPVDVTTPSNQEVNSVLEEFGLARDQYLLSTNGVAEVKGLRETLAVAKAMKTRHPDLEFVIAGKKRDWRDEVAQLSASGVIRYIGMVEHRKALCLSAGALANINLSRVEGMPRTTLETLAIGGRALVSYGVPEFDDAHPEMVIDPTDAESVINAVDELRLGDRLAKYDITQHLIPNVLSRYTELFDEVATSAKRARA